MILLESAIGMQLVMTPRDLSVAPATMALLVTVVTVKILTNASSRISVTTMSPVMIQLDPTLAIAETDSFGMELTVLTSMNVHLALILAIAIQIVSTASEVTTVSVKVAFLVMAAIVKT